MRHKWAVEVRHDRREHAPLVNLEPAVFREHTPFERAIAPPESETERATDCEDGQYPAPRSYSAVATGYLQRHIIARGAREPRVLSLAVG